MNTWMIVNVAQKIDFHLLPVKYIYQSATFWMKFQFHLLSAIMSEKAIQSKKKEYCHSLSVVHRKTNVKSVRWWGPGDTYNLITIMRYSITERSVVAYKLLTMRGGMMHIGHMDSDDVTHLLLLIKHHEINCSP